MSADLNQLAVAYSATTFRLAGPDGSIDIRVGSRSLALDNLLTTLDTYEWAYITAWNPRSALRSMEENTAAHRDLIGELESRGWLDYFEGEGIPDNPGWQPERSIWIAGIGRMDAVALGTQFGQNAIVAGQRGCVAELLFCPLADSAN